jgi:hypothetical protein
MTPTRSVDTYWKNIPGHEGRATCKCGAGNGIKTMQHILTECQYPGQEELWKLTKAIWTKKKGREWPYIMLGLIIRSTQVSFPSPKNLSKPDMGATRLFKILIAETAYLIWLLRNERVIQHKVVTPMVPTLWTLLGRSQPFTHPPI